MRLNIHCSTISQTQDTGQPKCPSVEEWTKIRHIYTVEYYSAIKKLFSSICSNMDGPGDYPLSEGSQTEKDKYPMILFTCGV